MHINDPLMYAKGFDLKQVGLLAIIRQNKNEDKEATLIKEMDEKSLALFWEKDVITTVKKKRKSDSDYKVMRLTPKGEKLLTLITQTYDVEEEDQVVFEWTKKLYLKLGKEIGSEIKCLNLISWFRRESGISKNNLVTLIKDFTSDDERMEYSKVLQYVFWKSENHFQTKPKLEDSKLWLYYERYRDRFDAKFE